MRISARLAAAGVTSVCLLGGAAGAATAATVTTAPVPVVQAQTDGWSRPSVKPAVIYVGQGGSPFVESLRWTHWNMSSARASGKLIKIKNPSCTPTYRCAYTRRWAAMLLFRPRLHASKYFYTRMRWVYYSGGHRRVARWAFAARPGGSVPGWDQY